MRFRVLQTMIVTTVVMNIRVLTAEFLELLLICAIAVATCRIVSDAGATYHSIVSAVDSTFVKYFCQIFNVTFILYHIFFSMLVNYIRRTSQHTDARY